MGLSTTWSINKQMQRDGRTLGHETLEEMRKLAVQRMNEGERPADVAASFGLHRSWAFKCRAMAKGRGRGLCALNATQATGRPRMLSATQERQVFRWVNGKNPLQYGFDFGLWIRQIVPGYAPDLNPDELVWSYTKRTGVARSPLRKGQKLDQRVNEQLQAVADDPALVRSFFGHPSVAYVSDR